MAALKKILKDIENVSELLFDRGWAEKNAGNLSVDVTEIFFERGLKKDRSALYRLDNHFENLKGHIFLITYSGSRFRDIGKDSKKNMLVLKIDDSGNGFYLLNSPGDRKPTSELKSHLKIHNYLREIRSDLKVVLHTHPTELITVSHIREYQSEKRLNDLLISAHPEVFINLPDKIGFVRYILTGSERLADETFKSLKRGKTLIIWERHGALSIERDVITAFDQLDVANKAAGIALNLLMAGRRPKTLTEKEFSELRELV